MAYTGAVLSAILLGSALGSEPVCDSAPRAASAPRLLQTAGLQRSASRPADTLSTDAVGGGLASSGCQIGGAPCNRRANLLPPDGKGWRGLIMGATSRTGTGDPQKFVDEYGTPLHLLRIFSKNPLTKEQKDFVKNGGILWYNIAIKGSKETWRSVADGQARNMKKWIQDVKQFKPAKVMVCIHHEPDHSVYPDKGYSAQDYRDMWDTVQAEFKRKKATNVVWVMDYSVGIGRGSNGQWQNALDLWPGRGKVDWLFFNIFQNGKKKFDVFGTHYYTNLTGIVYNKLLDASDKPCAYCAGSSSCSCGFKDVPWGMGAFGVGTTDTYEDKNEVTEKPLVSLPGQKIFFQDAKDGLAAFSRLRAYIYYDAKLSVITKEIKDDYVQFLTDDYFVKTD